ncbi:hypothetical protein RHA1_ro08562 (plasmid) [Rhodococcus jostii RHA1]|uniref:Uncharacterized protein n=1 Tax=Rhodococcus jostii (strain RHA1) TaxID=101510 RepID=Q0RYN0_RHOJR|nr:hypothetical protein RHA1_ro08562 [Rhodococcus jostii RHA1]
MGGPSGGVDYRGQVASRVQSAISPVGEAASNDSCSSDGRQAREATPAAHSSPMSPIAGLSDQGQSVARRPTPLQRLTFRFWSAPRLRPQGDPARWYDAGAVKSLREDRIVRCKAGTDAFRLSVGCNGRRHRAARQAVHHRRLTEPGVSLHDTLQRHCNGRSVTPARRVEWRGESGTGRVPVGEVRRIVRGLDGAPK